MACHDVFYYSEWPCITTSQNSTPDDPGQLISKEAP